MHLSPSRALLVALVLPFLPLAAQSAPASVPHPAAWLAGCWEARSERRTITEMWMHPDAGLMLGASRMVAGGAVREFEQLRIRTAGDTLVYTATPSGQRETEFRAASPGAGLLTFENLAHDFPQRIIYRRLSADSLVARVEGPGQGGTVRGFDIPMRRVGCGAG